MSTPETAALLARIQELGEYIKVRELQDGSIIALGDLIFTRAIYMDCDAEGFSRRYCFEDRKMADEQFANLTSDDETPVGYIAHRVLIR